jgi:hypothetical protein
LSGSILNDAGYARLRARNYQGARPLLEAAVRRLRGSGSIVYAYALYNLAATRFSLGDCNGVLAMLDRSQARQGRLPGNRPTSSAGARALRGRAARRLIA